MWVAYAFASAIFAGITAILAKIGLQKVDSYVATAVRTVVVVVFSWVMVFVAGSFSTIGSITLRSLFYLILSGLATGASWFCYFYALQKGDVNKVTPIDKSSTVLTMLLAWIFLKEAQGVPQVIGMIGIAIGTVLMILPAKKAGEMVTNEEATPVEAVVEEQQLDDEGAMVGQPERKSSRLRAQITKITKGRNLWFAAAIGSALFASLTSILGKIGIDKVESNLGTAIRTLVVLVMAWVLVEVTDRSKGYKELTKKNYVFLILSGITTGASWLCYYHALQKGKASVVMPIDKLSLLITIGFSSLILKEHLSRKALIGLVFLTAGTLFLLF